MSANIDALISEAQSALKANRKADARRALDTALSIDEMSEAAWLLMSRVVDSDSDQITCLENVLAINPSNRQAQQTIAALQSGARPALSDPAPTPFAQPFAAAESPFHDPPESDGWGDWAGMDVSAVAPPPQTRATSIPSSVEWGQPAEPGRADTRGPGQPSDADYDSWMAGLSLGSSKAGVADSRTGSGGMVPAFDTADFDSGPFSATSFDVAESDAPLTSGPRSSASPFDGFGFDDAPPVEAPARQDADPFGLRRSTAPAPAQPGNTGSSGPVADKAPAAGMSFSLRGAEPPALANARRQKSSAQTFDDYQAEPEPAANQPGRASQAAVSAESEPPSSNAAVFTTIDSTPGMANPSSYFSAIPEEIRNSSRLQPALIGTLVALVLVNLISLAVLFSNLAASGAHPSP